MWFEALRLTLGTVSAMTFSFKITLIINWYSKSFDQNTTLVQVIVDHHQPLIYYAFYWFVLPFDDDLFKCSSIDWILLEVRIFPISKLDLSPFLLPLERQDMSLAWVSPEQKNQLWPFLSSWDEMDVGHNGPSLILRVDFSFGIWILHSSRQALIWERDEDRCDPIGSWPHLGFLQGTMANRVALTVAARD